MNLSIWLLAASYAAGGPVDAPAAAPNGYVQPQAVTSSAPCNCGQSSSMSSNEAPARHGILSGLRNRLHNRFHHDEEMNGMPANMNGMPANQVIYQPSPMRVVPKPMAPTSAEPPQAMGASGASAIQQVSAQKSEKVEKAEKSDLEIRKEFQGKIGAAEDYSWITGQLFYVHADGGRWVLRYAGVDTDDKYGGSVVLKSAPDMKNYREGDLVSVNGQVLNDGRASRSLGGPLYRVSSISMMERAD